MNKDNMVFLLGGVVVGIVLGVFLANYSSTSRQTGVMSQAPVMQNTAPAGDPQNGSMDQSQLPAGHPPINQDSSSSAPPENEASLKQTIAAQEEILKKDPENQEATVTLANSQFDLKNYMEASKYYVQALKKDPKNPDLLTDLGSCYLWLNETDKAVDYYNQTLAIDPKHFQTLMNLGIARMTLGDRDGAAQAWEKVIEYYPDNPETPMLRDAVKRLHDKKAGNS